MKQKWSVRTYRKGDEEGLYELYQAVYPLKHHNRDFWFKRWHWMHRENPAGESLICLVEDKTQIIGHYAVVPVAMQCAGHIIRGAESQDLMVHPDYRRQGMFEALAKQTHHEAVKSGYEIIYGFPNQFSHPGFINKLGRSDIANRKIWIKPHDWNNIIKLKVSNSLLSALLATGASLAFDKMLFRTHKTPLIDRMSITKVTSFDERIDKLWTSVARQYPIVVIRNKDYLNWRYSSPDRNYSILTAIKADEISGYLVLIESILRNIKRTIILDMMAESKKVMHCLISEAVKISQQTGADRIIYNLIANKTFSNVLQANGFISLPFINGGHFCAYLETTKASQEFLLNPFNWLVQPGDSDRL